MKKIKTQLIGAGVLVSVLFFLTGCPNTSTPSAPLKQYTVTYSAEPSAGGTVTAKRKDNGATVTRGAKVYEGTVVVFTATPAAATGSSKGYYILGWSGEGLKISSDKTTAELTVKNNTEVKVQFQQYLIENTNWEAEGTLKDKSGSWKKFHLIISDGNTLTVFESSSGIGASKYGRMRYEPSTKTLSFSPGQGGNGSIEFTSIPQLPLPADWEIKLENVTVQGLKLENQKATINVTFNKDNFIH